MKRILQVAEIIALTTMISAFAQSPPHHHGALRVLWAPPPIDLPDEHPTSSVPREMIDRLQVESVPIVLNKTSRTKAQKALGGPVGRQGDAGDWEAWLCYHGRNSSGRWMLWLLSSEIDNENVCGFQWLQLSPGQSPDHRCKLIAGDNAVILPLALRPGMSESEARRVLGTPTLVSGNLLEYSYEHDQKIDQLDYTVTNDVNLVVEGSKVQSIQVWRSVIN